MHHLFGPLAILNFHNSFNCSDIGKHSGGKDPSKKEHMKLRINTMIAVCCHTEMLVCFSWFISLKINLRGMSPNYIAKFRELSSWLTLCKK